MQHGPPHWCAFCASRGASCKAPGEVRSSMALSPLGFSRKQQSCASCSGRFVTPSLPVLKWPDSFPIGRWIGSSQLAAAGDWGALWRLKSNNNKEDESWPTCWGFIKWGQVLTNILLFHSETGGLCLKWFPQQTSLQTLSGKGSFIQPSWHCQAQVKCSQVDKGCEYRGWSHIERDAVFMCWVSFIGFYHSVLLCLPWLQRYSIVTELVSSPFSKEDITQICRSHLSLCCKSTETFHHYSSIHYPWFIILTVYPQFTLGRKRRHIPTTEQNCGQASWQLPQAFVLWVLSKSLTGCCWVTLAHSLAEVPQVGCMELVSFHREFWSAGQVSPSDWEPEGMWCHRYHSAHPGSRTAGAHGQCETDMRHERRESDMSDWVLLNHRGMVQHPSMISCHIQPVAPTQVQLFDWTSYSYHVFFEHQW